MKKILNVLKAIIAVMVLLGTFIACDKDFSTIGTDVIGNDHFLTSSKNYSAISYNKKLDPVQTNGLSSNLLGVYQDPIYGTSKTNFVTQLSIDTRPIGVNIELDSVTITIPYFSHTIEDEDSDNTDYVLDSVFGDIESTMKLSVYRSNYFLNSFDPDSNFEDAQKYYSNGSTSQGAVIPVSELEYELLYEDDAFVADANPIIFEELNDEGEEEETGRLNPSLRIVFQNADGYTDMQAWQELIIDKLDDPELSNPNNFNEYFRGLYFDLENVTGDGAMFMLDFSSADISFYYKSVNEFEDEDLDGISDSVDADLDGDGITDEGKIDTDGDGIIDSADMDADDDGIDDDDKTDINDDGFDDAIVVVNTGPAVINLSGNRVNIFDNTGYNLIITNADSNADDISGDEKLYLKGGEGSMAIVDLFGGQDSAEFVEFVEHKDNWVINEANLVFYEDEIVIGDEGHEYDRLYLYDLKNNAPVIDYFLDLTSTTPNNSVVNHLGKRFTDEMNNVKYKIKITEHINNILLKDSTNTKLGLVFAHNINLIQNLDVFGTTNESDLNKVPVGTVLSPKGTVLYGNNTTNSDKKLKLEIYYTEPDN